MIVTFLDVCVWVGLYNIGLADLGFGFGLITALAGFGLVCRLWFPDFFVVSMGFGGDCGF